MVEAYIGAIFVDSEYNFSEVERFFDKHVLPYFVDMTIYDTFANNHPVTLLTNLLTITFRCTHFRILAKDAHPEEVETLNLAAVLVHDEVVAKGKASSGKNAKIKAAQDLLAKLRGLSRGEFREKFKCNCAKVGLE